MGSSDNLEKLRKMIDDLDREVLGLLNRRGEIVLRIGELKTENNVGVYDPVRESQIEKRLREMNPGPLSDDSVLRVYREIISACRALQQPLKVVFLGPEGSFSHQAAFHEFGGSAELLPVASFGDVFEEVENGRASYGVVPVENSIEGTIGIVLDLLSGSNLTISAEVFEKINLYLLSKSGSLKGVKVIASHPQPLAQCRKWLGKNLPNRKLRETSSTAEAAKLAYRNKGVAAVASRHSASIYKLKVLGKNIEDNNWNTTRFFVIGGRASAPSGNDRTSIVFTLRDKPGELQKSFFQPFAEAGVNLTKIESRPSKERPWEYLFFVDFNGHREDKAIKSLIEKVAKNCVYLKVLGSYPVGRSA
ncbi:MAG TPA: prephenate dehydratase [Thermodesulfobacteriota bacterium]|nr:prephenate dehydratase [Thermodesulfobacteriota bacterium]